MEFRIDLFGKFFFVVRRNSMIQVIEPKLVMKLVNFKPSKIHEKDVSGGSEEKLRVLRNRSRSYDLLV